MLPCNSCVEEVVYDVLEMGFKDLYCECHIAAISRVYNISIAHTCLYTNTNTCMHAVGLVYYGSMLPMLLCIDDVIYIRALVLWE